MKSVVLILHPLQARVLDMVFNMVEQFSEEFSFVHARTLPCVIIIVL